MLYFALSGLVVHNYLADNSMQIDKSIDKNAEFVMFYPNFIISTIKNFKDIEK